MKKYKILGILAMSAVMLTGCIDSMPELSSEQSDMIAEYAAGLLLKYSPNYNYMLVSDDELAAALDQKALEESMPESETMQQVEEAAVEEKSQEEAAPKADLAEEQTEEASGEAPVQMLADMDADLVPELGIAEDVLLRYQSFEICDTYPQNASGFSGIDAKEGSKLLVLHFDLENDTEEAVDCQLFDDALQLRITVNDSITRGTEDTPMLPDDMVSFAGTLEAGEKTDVIAVAQIEELSDSEIASLMLQISSSNGSCSIKIR